MLSYSCSVNWYRRIVDRTLLVSRHPTCIAIYLPGQLGKFACLF